VTWRIEMLGTTAIVLLVGGMMLWSEAVVRGPRLILTIGSAAVLYVVCLVLLGRRSDPTREVENRGRHGSTRY
jgi:uncharacterized membrane protein